MSRSIERFMAKVREGDDGCWHWTASKVTSGYGQFPSELRTRLAHRYAYTVLVGPIPEGLTIDHLCRNRLCVNPAHLEAVTMRENNLRGVGPCARKARQTHCKRGHALTADNLCRPQRSKPNSRMCKACHRQKVAGQRASRRAHPRIA